MLRPNLNLYPAGGWRYVHTDGQPFSAGSRDALEHELVEYLIEKGEPHENALDLIDAFICAKHKSICREQSTVPLEPLSADVAQSARIASFMARTMRRFRDSGASKNVFFVNAVLANARAGTCRACPLNQPHRVTCGTCENSLKSAASLLVKAAPTGVVDSGLKSCQHYSTYLPVFTRLANGSADVGAPSGCWRRVS